MNAQDIKKIIPELFAPWVQDLELEAIELSPKLSTFRLPVSKRIIRGGGTGGGVICGQALASAADTVSVMSLCHANNRFRACTTTDINIRFMRPLAAESDAKLIVRILSNGRRMAVTEIQMHSHGSDKLAAMASCSFMFLED